MSRTNTSSEPVLENAGFLLAKASQRYNELLLARFAALGFPEVKASFGSVLTPLFMQDGLRIGELARLARLSKQSLTGVVRLCSQAGLVAREADPSDGRAAVIRLTPRGREFSAVARRALAELDQELAAALGQNDHNALLRALKGVMEL